MQFLPRGPEVEQVLQLLLTGDNFHFGSPFLNWQVLLHDTYAVGTNFFANPILYVASGHAHSYILKLMKCILLLSLTWSILSFHFHFLFHWHLIIWLYYLLMIFFEEFSLFQSRYKIF